MNKSTKYVYLSLWIVKFFNTSLGLSIKELLLRGEEYCCNLCWMLNLINCLVEIKVNGLCMHLPCYSNNSMADKKLKRLCTYYNREDCMFVFLINWKNYLRKHRTVSGFVGYHFMYTSCRVHMTINFSYQLPRTLLLCVFAVTARWRWT